MKPLLQGSLAFLENAFDEREALFSFSTRLRDGRLEQDFAHPGVHRYTVNSLLGLRQASAWPAELPDVIDRFLDRQYPKLESPADLGLVLVLLADRLDEPRAFDALRRVRAAAEADGAGLHMQDLAWMLWGASAAGAQPIADRLYQTIVTRFVDPRTGLPRHTLSKLRGHVVSFGTIVYFLRALHEYATAFGVADARRRFEAGVERILGVQGPQGEWPWLIGVRSGVPLDFYPVFTVHQDSMAMLFLLPALDAGLDVRGAIDASFAWNLGANQLGTSMVVQEPFLIYRSIERGDRLPRARRYARSLLGRQAGLRDGGGVRINTEARSYHLGWILYAWAGRNDVPSLA